MKKLYWYVAKLPMAKLIKLLVAITLVPYSVYAEIGEKAEKSLSWQVLLWVAVVCLVVDLRESARSFVADCETKKD